MCGGCVRGGPGRAREVSGVWRFCRAPLSRQALATAPAWESFPDVNRVLTGRLLALLIERIVRAASGGDGGERGEHCGQAALGAG
jgi:hypothetical protein